LFSFRYINKNEQPTSISYTLLIEYVDMDQVQTIVRIEKKFKEDARQIDEEFLRTVAMAEIYSLKQAIENPIVVPPIEELPVGDFSE